MAEGRFALVTGGAQGLGFAAAKRFLEIGFAGVMLVDRNGAKLRDSARKLSTVGRVEVFEGDLLNPVVPGSAVEAAVNAFGRLDVVVSAAGTSERCGLEDTDWQTFDRVFAVNTRAPLLLMQAAVKAMKPNGGGVIINVSSMLAHGGPPNLATYAASKSALNVLTRSAANTVKRQGIRIFGINLGWVNSEGEHTMQTGFHGMPQDWADAIGRRMPSGRLIVPDDVAGLVAYLVSPSAQMMTGAIIDYEQMPFGVFDEHPALETE